MSTLEEQIRKILSEELGSKEASTSASGNKGVFKTVDEAVGAAKKAQEIFVDCSIETRNKVIDAIKDGFAGSLDYIAEEILKETGMGTADAKVLKLENALFNTPGTEDLTSEIQTGDGGLIMYEYAPYGVIGAVTPSTNPVETVIANAIMMLAGGNTVYFSVHPGAKNISRWAVEKVNEFIYDAVKLENLVVTIEKPSIEAAQEMMAHKDIDALVVTGGPGVVHQAMISGKKAIGAGAGNPPAMVDASADVALAARNIVESAAFDNNILCTAEKEVIAVQCVKDDLIRLMQAEGAFLLTAQKDIDALLALTLRENGTPSRQFIGKDATYILDEAKISYTGKPNLIIMETAKDHPFVEKEMLMPIVPVVCAKDFDDMLQIALEAEGGNHHTSSIHSGDLKHINKAAHRMNTSIFVVNGPTFAGTGVGFTGASALTISTPTGEGTTTAKTFTRRRRLNSPQGFSMRVWRD
ncbi:aldehyde dehydrogenase family protein [Vagococcus intermedius]|uniref:Aldehyde dehydrogenase EutE n=1 Tax=Vagococcus intermedius TaxID=2991418 RepID=A0AAF0CTD6_9ENTE|nr:aldehyde dehydrogenase family protein [Vagococcus intermedius]WEG72506.1 aldehyde dehydrogenase EutE [Vagococcus intermedius]WEG74593.1 aldehyde dehydrogenase EutE [Vagococcus intermedius]